MVDDLVDATCLQENVTKNKIAHKLIARIVDDTIYTTTCSINEV